jgi:hypothetical protein
MRGRDWMTNHRLTLHRLSNFLLVTTTLENLSFLLDLYIVDIFVKISKNTKYTLTYCIVVDLVVTKINL